MFRVTRFWFRTENNLKIQTSKFEIPVTRNEKRLCMKVTKFEDLEIWKEAVVLSTNYTNLHQLIFGLHIQISANSCN